MDMPASVHVAIIDYGLGNLYSVARACSHVGMDPTVTNDRQIMSQADLLILPGVGAFGDAMDALHRLDLISFIRDWALSGRPMMGICLGLQLLLDESEEFGRYAGLGLIPGRVIRFADPVDATGRRLKVPQVGWNRIFRPNCAYKWEDTPLAGIEDTMFMYFVHSYHAIPENLSAVMSVSRYGNMEFCSGLREKNIFAFQFHPERSGPDGISIYRQCALWVMRYKTEGSYER